MKKNKGYVLVLILGMLWGYGLGYIKMAPKIIEQEQINKQLNIEYKDLKEINKKLGAELLALGERCYNK